MRLYRDQVLRLSLPGIKARFTPRAFTKLKTVRLEHAGFTADVELMKIPAPGIPSGWRTKMRCPRCRLPAEVVGCVPPGLSVEPGWACARCTRWRGRPGSYSVGVREYGPS